MYIADLNNIGTGNQLVQSIGCNANLARVALRIGLDKYIVTAQDIVPPQSLLATTMEAVLGAIDCDSGEDANAVRQAMYMVGLTPKGTS
jgi:dsRNA-specific ribonuclease